MSGIGINLGIPWQYSRPPSGGSAIIAQRFAVDPDSGAWEVITSAAVSTASTSCWIPSLELLVYALSNGDIYSCDRNGGNVTLRHSFSASNSAQRLAHYPGEDRVYVGHIVSTADDRVYFLSGLTADPGLWTYNAFNDAVRVDDLAVGNQYVYAFDTITSNEIRALSKVDGAEAFAVGSGSDCVSWDEANSKMNHAAGAGINERDPDLTSLNTWATRSQSVERGGLTGDLSGRTFVFMQHNDLIERFDRANGASQVEGVDDDILTYLPLTGSTAGISFGQGLEVDLVVVAPTGVLASTGAGAAEISASWDAVAGANRYHTYFLDVNGKRRYDGTTTGTSKTITTDAGGVLRTIQVQAVDDDAGGSAPELASASAVTGS